MAYFKWRGVDLAGMSRQGKMFARSEDDLSTTLLEQEIALISCTFLRPRFFSRSVSLDVKISFFRQLAVLLDAGVMLPDALEILGSLINNIRLQEIICDLGADVQEGVPLSEALKKHPDVFDSLMVRMVRVGQETGRLGTALEHLSEYLEATQAFRKKLKSAAMLPMVTFGFFALIAVTIFVFIVPRFADIFKSMKKELPAVTKLVVGISRAMRSSVVLLVIVSIVLVVLAIRQYMKTTRGREAIDRLVLHIPWLGDPIKNSSLTYFLHSVSMLLNSGVRLLKAMEVASLEIKNSVVRSQVEVLQQEVAAGVSLSQAMNRLPNSLFGQDLVSLARVGEESGNLGDMLKKGAAVYQEKVRRSLVFFTTVFQPMLMIILGLLITLLIFAIYLPVFNLANVV